MNFGLGINSGILVDNANFDQVTRSFRITAFVIQPKLFAEIYLADFPKFHPSVGLGYSFIVFSANGINQGIDVRGTSETESGLNTNVAVAFDLTDWLYVQIQYDFIKLNVDNSIPSIPFNTNVNLFKFGAGFRI